jgi:hypothetical protein
MSWRIAIALASLLTLACAAHKEAANPHAVSAATSIAARRALVSLKVEFPDGAVVETPVNLDDCPTAESCWYTLEGFVEGGLRRAGLEFARSCTGPSNRRECAITSIRRVANSRAGRWVMYRDGHRSAYPYNRVLHESQSQHIVFRFLTNSERTP